jgi:putative phage-type endonuclease
MKTHSLIQGSKEWLAYRAQHFNASDAPAMMGCSAYKTRTQLLREMHTGMTPDVDAGTQRLFDDGHKFEAMARPLAEAIIGMELYPVTGSGGKLSASFDGLTMCETIAFEHKTLNADLREAITDIACGYLLPMQYRVQMEQQLMVSGAEKCLFMASKWNGNELVEERHTWYYPDFELRKKIIDGWAQFEADLADYIPQASEVKAVASPQFGLPAVSIQVNGSISLIDNLQAFGAALTTYVEKINLKPETDQDFADLEATVKTLKNAEDALDAAESGALAQTESIDTMRRTVAMYRDTARTNRLLVDKLVKSEKDNRRATIVVEAAKALSIHIKALNERLGAHFMPVIPCDFPSVVKGLKSIDSMRDKVATELARAKIEANATADKITLNLRAINEHADYAFLFADVAQLALKDYEFVAMAIKNRIAEHQAKEAARIAAETARIAEQERIKAEQAAKVRADAEIAAATTKARFEAHAQAQADAEAKRASDEVIAKAQAEHPAVVAAVAQFDEDVRVMLTMPTKPALYVPHSATPPDLKLGQICIRLGLQVTADFLKSLGFEPAGRDRAAVLFHEADFPRICAALVRHIQSVSQGVEV